MLDFVGSPDFGSLDVLCGVSPCVRHNLGLFVGPAAAQSVIFPRNLGPSQLNGAVKLGGFFVGFLEGALGNIADTFGFLSPLLKYPRHWLEEDVLQVNGQKNKKDNGWYCLEE
jgi:hypothetical protein